MGGGEGQTIKVWLLPSGIPTEPGQAVGQLRVKFAEKPDDKVSGGEGQTIKVWSIPLNTPIEPGQPVSQLEVKFAEKANDKVSGIENLNIKVLINCQTGLPIQTEKIY